MQRPIICDSCKHLDRYVNPVSDDVPMVCSSFPMGIPRAIYYDGADHRTSLAGEPPHELLEGYEEVLADYEAEREREMKSDYLSSRNE